MEWVQLKEGAKTNGLPKTLADYEPYDKQGNKVELPAQEVDQYEVGGGVAVCVAVGGEGVGGWGGRSLPGARVWRRLQAAADCSAALWSVVVQSLWQLVLHAVGYCHLVAVLHCRITGVSGHGGHLAVPRVTC